MKLKLLDLFGGIGGFHEGFRRAGGDRIELAGYYDIDKYATAVYNYNYGTDFLPTDITLVETDDIPDFDILCAGFPCQPFSTAGKRKGFGDTRGTLFFEIARILEAKRPPYFVLENVKGLLSHDNGKTFRVIVQTLEELGYEFQWMVLDSQFFGVPQYRERIYIVGNLRGRSRPKILPFRNSVQQDKGRAPAETFRKKRMPELILYHSRSRRVYGTNTISITVTANSGGMTRQTGAYLVDEENMKIRILTPVEAERLQGFPDNWTKYGKFWDKYKKKWIVKEMTETRRYKLLGNAVTVNVVAAIADRLLESIEGD